MQRFVCVNDLHRSTLVFSLQFGFFINHILKQITVEPPKKIYTVRFLTKRNKYLFLYNKESQDGKIIFSIFFVR